MMSGKDNNIVPLPTKDKASDQKAIEALKERFVRFPSKSSYPQFKDLQTGSIQGDSYILEHFYRVACKEQGLAGDQEKNGTYLLKCLPVVYGETFEPHQPRITNNNLVNLWQPPALEPSGNKVEADQVPLFIEFLDRWFPIKEEKEYFLCWLASTVRRQDIKIISTPLLRSDHGMGKGFFVETLLAELLGKHSVSVCALKDVVGDFNEIIEGKTFLLIDEVYRSKTSTTNALKSIQGNATISLNRKHQAKVTIDNYLNIIVTSNDMIPVLLEDGDRRFFVPQFIKHKESQSETAFFINKQLKPWLKYHGGFQLVRDYLETVDLDNFYATSPAPITKAKKDLLGHSTESKLNQFLTEYIKDKSVVTIPEIQRDIPDELDRRPTSQVISSVLLSLDCVRKALPQRNVWITNKGQMNGLSKDSPPKEIKEFLSKHNF